MQLHTVGFVRPSYIPNMKNNGCGRFSHLCRQCTAHCTTMYATNLPMLSVDSICWAISIVANVFYPLPGITRLRTDSLLQIRDVITSTLMAHNTRTHKLIEMHIQLNALRALMAYWQFINKKKKNAEFHSATTNLVRYNRTMHAVCIRLFPTEYIQWMAPVLSARWNCARISNSLLYVAGGGCVMRVCIWI